MEDTCCICNHHHSILIDGGNDYRIHDWCDVWETTIPSYYRYCRKDLPETGFNDIEVGEAVCWCFDRMDNEQYIFFKSARVKENQEYNQNLSKK